MTEYDFKRLKNIVVAGAYSMADELGTQRPKNVTTIKPSGTLSKVMDTTEGCHMPPGKYIFNNVNFSVDDPIVERLRAAGYATKANPVDEHNVLVTLPVAWHNMRFKKTPETAIDQLERYKMLMCNYVEQNCSVTISYRSEEIPCIIDWLLLNWEHYVGVSFLPIGDAETAGYSYLPQEVVTKEVYEKYVSQLLPVDLDTVTGIHDLQDDECVTGACPTK